MHVVIVGNGIAGIEAARTLRVKDAQLKITIISEESDHFFSRTALMWIACGQLSHADSEPFERNFYEKQGFERIRARATHVDVANKKVSLAGRGVPSNVSYDKLIIACGSHARPGPWPGSNLKGVGNFVTHQDLEWFDQEVFGKSAKLPPRHDHHVVKDGDSPYRTRPSAASQRGRLATKPAVIGGGLIGIESIEVLLAAKKKRPEMAPPKFFIREDWFWPIALDQTESTWVANALSEHGVDVHLQHNLTEIGGEDGLVTRIETDKGTYEADLALIAIGVISNTGWLTESDIQLERGAIVVDGTFQTSAKDVYAAGDCAAVKWFNGMQRPEQLWYTGRDQGQLVALSVLGETVNYERGLFYNSAKLMDIEYTTAGLVNWNVEGEQNWFFEETGKVRSTTRITVVGDSQKVVGFNALGRRWNHDVILSWIEEGRDLTFVLGHLPEASFDTEFVPALQVPKGDITLQGPAPSFSKERLSLDLTSLKKYRGARPLAATSPLTPRD